MTAAWRAYSDILRSGRGKEIRVVRFHAAGRGQIAVVGVHGDEQIGLRLVGDAGAIVERNVVVVLTRVDHFHAEAAFEQLAQTLRDFKHQIFFQQAATADGAEVPAAVSGIDDDAHFGHARAQLQVFFGRRRNHDGELVLLRFAGVGEQVHRALGSRPDLAYFNDQAVRIRFQTDREG